MKWEEMIKWEANPEREQPADLVENIKSGHLRLSYILNDETLVVEANFINKHK